MAVVTDVQKVDYYLNLARADIDLAASLEVGNVDVKKSQRTIHMKLHKL